MRASIIICTRNRADSLAKTLDSFESVVIPPGLHAEILIVDNGSTDHTAEVVRRHSAAKLPVRYLVESSPGLSKARNAGLAASNGDVILFTDDDVAPNRDWLGEIAAPLVRREFDGVVGRIELANEVCRPWMTPQHKACLAVYEGPVSEAAQLIGANMGFHRSVIGRIPQFDPELGAGALGFAEEALFSWQMVEAGFRIAYVATASVIHYPDRSRLTRSGWLSIGQRHGATWAYLMHHWFHENLPNPRLRYYYRALKLRVRRLIESPQPLDVEGIAPWELSYVREMENYRHFLIERERPRKYSMRGLRKMAPISQQESLQVDGKRLNPVRII